MGLNDTTKYPKEIIYDKCRICKHFSTIYFFVGSVFDRIAHRCAIRYVYAEDCERWEKRDDVKEKQNEKAKDVLYDIRKKLDTIERILLLPEEYENTTE